MINYRQDNKDLVINLSSIITVLEQRLHIQINIPRELLPVTEE